MDIDEALDFVGGYRRWHVGMFIALGISLFLPLAYQGLSGVFIGKNIILRNNHVEEKSHAPY